MFLSWGFGSQRTRDIFALANGLADGLPSAVSAASVVHGSSRGLIRGCKRNQDIRFIIRGKFSSSNDVGRKVVVVSRFRIFAVAYSQPCNTVGGSWNEINESDAGTALLTRFRF